MVNSGEKGNSSFSRGFILSAKFNAKSVKCYLCEYFVIHTKYFEVYTKCVRESNSSLLCFYLFCCKHFDWFTVFKLPTMHFSEKSLLKIVIIINIRAVAKIRSASSAKIQENVKNMKNFRSTSPLHYFQPWIKHRRKRGWKNLTARSERKFSAPSFCVSNPISNPISHISYGSRAADQSLNTTFWQKTPILSP